MSDEAFVGGVIVGVFGGAVLATIVSAAWWGEYSRSSNDEWQKQCVVRGVADYYNTDGGGVEWRWKDE
jgi:hypothetical protein